MPSNEYHSWRTGIQIDNIYPIGSIYMSINPTNPSELFGGAWEAIAQGTFLISAGTDYTVGNSYGSSSHTHTQVATTSGGPSNNTSGGPSNNTSGGPSNNTSGSTAISVAQMPSHTHTFRSGAGPGLGVATGGSDNPNYYCFADDVRATATTFYNTNTGSGSGHTHTLSSHTHTLSSHTHSTAATTTGSASNIPPSLAVYMWQRTG